MPRYSLNDTGTTDLTGYEKYATPQNAASLSANELVSTIYVMIHLTHDSRTALLHAQADFPTTHNTSQAHSTDERTDFIKFSVDLQRCPAAPRLTVKA